MNCTAFHYNRAWQRTHPRQGRQLNRVLQRRPPTRLSLFFTHGHYSTLPPLFNTTEMASISVTESEYSVVNWNGVDGPCRGWSFFGSLFTFVFQAYKERLLAIINLAESLTSSFLAIFFFFLSSLLLQSRQARRLKPDRLYFQHEKNKNILVGRSLCKSYSKGYALLSACDRMTADKKS